MQELEKFVFDRDRPKDFVGYGLLKEIVLKKQNTVVIDPYWWGSLFEHEIFDRKGKEAIYDKPEGFENLNGIEKARLYIQQYSMLDWIEYVHTKIEHLFGHHDLDLFEKFLSGTNSQYQEALHFEHGSELLNPETYYGFVEGKSHFDFRAWDNFVLFYTSYSSSFYIPENPAKTCLLICTEQDYLEHFADKLKAWQYQNIKPIVVKNPRDILFLLSRIRRDLEQGESGEPGSQIGANIDEAQIENYFSIDEIHLKGLSKKKEIYILGENGTGKTILLQALLLALRGNPNEGMVSDIVKHNPRIGSMILAATTADGKKLAYERHSEDQKESHKAVFAYGISRFRNDSLQKDHTGFGTLFDRDLYLESPEEWLQDLDYREAKGESPSISLHQAKNILKDLFEDQIEITVETDGVSFVEKGTSLKFEQLSDGYRSVLIWICDLISRMAEVFPDARTTADFSGIVLVDEIGVYLHPKWQWQLVKKLRNWFPNIQWIFTTHSPMAILGASKDATFYKLFKEEGKTQISQPVRDISNLMANAIITSPLFGLESARQAAYDPEKDQLDQSDDYLFSVIHREISDKVREQADMAEEDIIALVKKELDEQTEDD